jgi:cytochrome c biogenesis protein CcmG/thiol:disulfide interchange protein DsbE
VTRFIVPLVAFGALVVVLAVGIKHSPDLGTIKSPLIGHQAPQFSLPSLTNAEHSVSSAALKGRWSVVNVWGTWCPGCREEHPVLVEIARQKQVSFVGIDWKDDDAQALGWLADLGNPYDLIGADRDGRVAIDWGVYGAPETFLVNPQGIIVHKQIGAMTREVWERDFLPRLKPAGS